MKRFHFPHRLKNLLLVLAGNAVYALAVNMFVLPCGLITGGTTGLALAAQHYLGLPVADFVLISNVVMFVLGAAIMGKWFAFNTALSTFCYPLLLKAFAYIPGIGSLTRDPLLATIFAGVMIGGAIGLVIGAGASSGGMDIPPILLNKFFGLPISGVMYVLDFVILIGQMSFAEKDQILYGVLLVLLYTLVLEKVVLMGHSKIQVNILSEKKRGDPQDHPERAGPRLHGAARPDRLYPRRAGHAHDHRDQPRAGKAQPSGAGGRPPGVHVHQLRERGARPRLHPAQNLQITRRCAAT